MSRSLLLLLQLGILCSLPAQNYYLPLDSLVDNASAWENLVEAGASLDYNANTIYNELTYAVWSGQFLDRDLRQRSLDAMRSRNSVGFDQSFHLSWTGALGLWGRHHWRPLIKAAHHDMMGTRFTSDVFELAFFGNAGFEGERADLGPSAHSHVRYQSLGAGILDDRSGSFVRLDLLLGQSVEQADIRWAGIYTAEDGRVIRATLLGEYQLSDTAGSEFGRNNGMGVSFSGRWNTVLKGLGSTTLSIGLEDFGLIRWNEHSVALSKDTVIEFLGWDVANILDLDNVLIGEDQLIDTLGLRYTPGAFTSYAPLVLTLSLEKQLAPGWRGGLEVMQRYLPGFIPQVTAFASRRLGTRSLLGANLSYGGFGDLRLGLSGRMRLGDRVWIHLSTPNLPGFLLGTTRGYGMQGGLMVGF